MPLAASLPSWVDPDRLLSGLAVAAVVVPLGLVWLAWRIHRTVLRVVAAGVAIGVGLSLWGQRAELADCVAVVQATLDASGDTGEGTCRVFGIDVAVPAS